MEWQAAGKVRNYCFLLVVMRAAFAHLKYDCQTGRFHAVSVEDRTDGYCVKIHA
jgi:hypothetical protein